MKSKTVFVLVSILLLLFSGCGNISTPVETTPVETTPSETAPVETTSSTKKVQLTTTNWKQYFSIDLSEDYHGFYYRDINYGGAYFGSEHWGFVRLDVTVTLKKGISLENVVIEILLNDWNDVWGDKTLSITMPSNGATTTKSTNSNQISQANAVKYKPVYVPEVTGISGYVIVNNN